MRFHLRFAPPGFFLNDPRLVVTLDSRTLYDGSFRAGFDVSVELDPGVHVLTTALHLVGSVAREQRIELSLDEARFRDVRVIVGTLEYSRMMGAFKNRVSLSARH